MIGTDTMRWDDVIITIEFLLKFDSYYNHDHSFSGVVITIHGYFSFCQFAEHGSADDEDCSDRLKR